MTNFIEPTTVTLTDEELTELRILVGTHRVKMEHYAKTASTGNSREHFARRAEMWTELAEKLG